MAMRSGFLIIKEVVERYITIERVSDILRDEGIDRESRFKFS